MRKETGNEQKVMTKHRYILEPYKGMNTRYHCPGCQNRVKTFTLYIDIETGEHVNPSVGRCNREDKCGYHYTPKHYFEDERALLQQPKKFKNKNSLVTTTQFISNPHKTVHSKPFSLIPLEQFKQSLKHYKANHFVTFLINLFGVDITGQLISKYFIGTSKHWPGATVFWQIDKAGKIRTGKIMLYDPFVGKRIKEPFPLVSWAHKVLKLPEFNLQQCFFGEHLLKENTKQVAIVESEKTAVIASVYLPQFIWIAAGNMNGLNKHKSQVLKGRTVTLFPDLNGFEKWNNLAKELYHIIPFSVSDLLEIKASDSDKKQGLDLADYLIKFDYKEFIHSENLTKPNIATLTNANKARVDNNPQPTPQDVNPPVDHAAALINFENWLTLNPAGGEFEFEGQRIKITHRRKLFQE